MGTAFPSIHPGIMVPPNSIGVRKCWGHLQATQMFGIFPFIALHWDRDYVHPTSFICSILPYFWLSLARHELWSFGNSITTRCNESWASDTLVLKYTSPAVPGENISSLHLIFRSILDTRNPSRSTISLGAQTCWRIYMCYSQLSIRHKIFGFWGVGVLGFKKYTLFIIILN